MAFTRPAGGVRRERRGAGPLAEPERLELVDVAVLRSLVSSAALAYRDTPAAARPAQLLEQALLLRELAGRTGEAEVLRRAGLAVAAAAARSGEGEGRLLAAARLQQALCALTAAELFGDGSGFETARETLDEAERLLGCQPGRLNGPGLIRARLMADAALVAADRGLAGDAAALYDETIAVLAARVRATGSGRVELAEAERRRAELAIAMGVKLRDAGLLDEAARVLGIVTAGLDPDYLPLSWARAETLRGAALRHLGEITGEARLLHEAAAACEAALEAAPVGSSPLDRAHAAHGLALARQAAAESAADRRLYASALAAFDQAISETAAPELALRPILAHDRAVCLARQAERGSDARALQAAEEAFKAELAGRAANADPVAWAVTQVALARIYEARADLLGDAGERADAAFALTEAMEVFAERGLKSMTEIAAAALERLRAHG